MSSRRYRQPSQEELRQWHAVTRSVTPIGRPAEEPPEAEPEPEKPAPPPAVKAEIRPAPRRDEQRHRLQPSPLDRRLTGRLARGRVDIDGRIDLHGMTQTVAHGRLATFLHDAQSEGLRLVLVITGKGAAREDRAWHEPERGVLRRMVPQWLNSAELRPFVVGYGEAARRHGGSGALYVRIRRRRR